jgi:hypothetical protein
LKPSSDNLIFNGFCFGHSPNLQEYNIFGQFIYSYLSSKPIYLSWKNSETKV